MSTATVLAVQGQAWIQSEDGTLRELRPGDQIQDGERLVTSQGGEVSIAPGGTGAPQALTGSGQVSLWESPQGAVDAVLHTTEAGDSAGDGALDSLGVPLAAGSAALIDAPVPDGTQAASTGEGEELAELAELADQADNVLGTQSSMTCSRRSMLEMVIFLITSKIRLPVALAAAMMKVATLSVCCASWSWWILWRFSLI